MLGKKVEGRFKPVAQIFPLALGGKFITRTPPQIDQPGGQQILGDQETFGECATSKHLPKQYVDFHSRDNLIEFLKDFRTVTEFF